MELPRKFLVIDDNVPNRFLLTRTIQRKYPRATIIECGDPATALEAVSTEQVDLVVTHRAGMMDGVELVRELRRVASAVPIIMVSGWDRGRAALAAGATRFHHYEEWLRLGVVIEEVLATRPWAGHISALTYAIRERCIVTFDYVNAAGVVTAREVEPHVLGETAEGQLVLRGFAASRPRGWETYYVSQMRHLMLTDRTFVPHEANSSGENRFARVLCSV